MKTRKIFILAFLLGMLSCILCGCADTDGTATPIKDNGVTNTEVYDNYNAWRRNNQIRLFINISNEMVEGNLDSEVSKIGELELPKSKQKKIDELREGMISYFLEEYKIDISEKLEKQEVAIYTATGSSEGVMGSVDLDNPNVLNLNQKLLKEYSEVFETTYVHESLHQIGFHAKKPQYIDEGITDALTDMIFCFMGKSPVLTEYYSDSRCFAYQLLAADPEIVSCYLENDNFEIIDRINQKLKDVPQTLMQVDSLGKRLEGMQTALYNIKLGVTYPIEAYYFALEAQEIVKAYCQECNPDDATIDYIRGHYLVEDYEDISISHNSDGSYIIG